MGTDPTPADTGGRRCPHCSAVLVPAAAPGLTERERKVLAEMASYRDRAASGVCVVRRCPESPGAGHVYCPRHRDALNARTREAKARARKKARKGKKRAAA